MNSAESFSADYPEARAKFLDAAKDAGGALESIRHPERGPDGGELTTDIAWLGPKSAEAVLVMLSATHGVEGFCGSGAQVDWLRRDEASRLPPGIGVMMVHAINPYGFAWLRRVTQENVDLNRNWVDFSNQRPVNNGYDQLAEALCPSAWDQETQQRAAAVLTEYQTKNGIPAYAKAVSGGQYKHKDGIFYGGDSPTWSCRTQTEIYNNYLQDTAQVAILDYHTALGPWGYAEKIITVPRSHPAFERATSWYGNTVGSIVDGTSSSAELAGDGLTASYGVLSKVEVTGIAVEVGTLPSEDVILALRADAWLHAHGDPLSPKGAEIKAQMRRAFYGDSDDWKGMVAGQSLLIARQAIKGLSKT